MARIVVVVGHARAASYCGALGESYAQGARAGGHEVKLFVTSKMAFDPILREGFERAQPLEPDLAEAHDAMLAADHLVMIFPLWMGMLPAIFRGFLERVFQPDLVEGAKQRSYPKLLKGKSALVVVTMGMPALVYRWWFGAYAVKALRRNILRFMGVGHIRTIVLGGVEAVGAEGRMKWLADMEQRGRHAA